MEHDTDLVQNPGSPGWSAGGALVGHILGSSLGLGLLGGISAARAVSKVAAEEPGSPESMQEPFKVTGMAILGSMLGGAAGAAAGAAVGAPAHLRSKAATWAALGGAVPFFGVALGPVAAYMATKPEGSRRPNLGTGSTIGLAILGLAAAGGATYAGMKVWKDRKAKKEIEAREPTVLVYPIDDVDGLTIDLGPDDDLQIETGNEQWAWNSELPAKDMASFSPSKSGWVVEASREYAGTWDVEMVGPQHYAEFKVKIHDV